MSGKESGWEGVDFKGWLIYPNFGFRERGGGGEGLRDFGCFILDF